MRIIICASWVGRSTASGCSACGARKGSGFHSGGASADGWASRRSRLSGCGPNGPTRCGRSTFQFDQTADGRVLKLLNVVDEHTRESLEMLVERSIDADRTVEVLEGLAADRGAPEHLRCDNGPEMTGHALRDWCRFSKTGTAFIEPGSPWQNPFVESFHARVRDELLDVEEFSCLAEARVVIGDWQQDYNWRRPHSALGMLAPTVFAAQLAAAAEV